LRKTSFCQSSPWCISASVAPCESSGKLPQARFAASIISFTGTPTACGRPWPPNSVGEVSPHQPFSANCA